VPISGGLEKKKNIKDQPRQKRKGFRIKKMIISQKKNYGITGSMCQHVPSDPLTIL
jgi:hypothetical protein